MRPPKRRSASEQRLLEKVLKKCEAEGAKVLFKPVRSLGKGGFTGLFEPDALTLTVAVKAKFWFQTLLHEYSHFLQHLKGQWVSEFDIRKFDAFNDWMAGDAQLSTSRLIDCVRTIQSCELDAEKRVVRLRRSWHLPTFNWDRYIRGANVYVLSYEAARLTRKWPKDTLYYNAKIERLVPGSFIRRLDKLPHGFLDAYLAEC